MLSKELQTAINHMSPDNRRVAEAIVIFYEDYYGLKLVQMESRLKALEDQLAKNSRNSNKPPSSDTFNKPAPKSLRKKTVRKPGGPKGHDGTTLKMVDFPDVQVTHRVGDWEVCKNHLGNEVAGQIERRQVYDLPDLKFLVTEHQAEFVRSRESGGFSGSC
jgi:transposase